MQNPKETPRSREEVEELVRRLGDPSAGSIMPIREKINGRALTTGWVFSQENHGERDSRPGREKF